jgi:hypothetical protein
LHIEAYHSQINNRKKKQRIKTSQEIYGTKWKIEGKTVILFKRNKMETFPYHQHNGLTQISKI